MYVLLKTYHLVNTTLLESRKELRYTFCSKQRYYNAGRSFDIPFVKNNAIRIQEGDSIYMYLLLNTTSVVSLCVLYLYVSYTQLWRAIA